LIARYPDGMPVKNARVDYSNYDLTYTDDRGVANIKFMYTGQRYLNIEVSDESTSVSEKYYITGTKGIKVIPDKTYYDVGEIAYMEVVYTADKSATKWVYYDILSRGFVVNTGHFKLDNDNEGNFKVPITSDLAPLAEVRVYKTQKDLSVVNDIALFGVGSDSTDLNVSIETDKELYTPNDDIILQFSVTDRGVPIQTALGLAFVDQSVFEIHERFSGFEKIIHDLEEEFITPQYQICNYVYSPNSPLGSIPDESESVVSQKELSSSGKSSMLTVTGTGHYDYSIQLENYYATYYWNIIIFLALISFLGLFILALKYKFASALIMVILIVLPFIMIVVAGTFYVWVSGFGTSGSEKGLMEEETGEMA
ncbi:MAG: hypothetical protein KAJ51_08020, partial [Thermoplasmata archaeon]|nr:hypothetical protein [Thermoplasmata archaeon]